MYLFPYSIFFYGLYVCIPAAGTNEIPPHKVINEVKSKSNSRSVLDHSRWDVLRQVASPLCCANLPIPCRSAINTFW